MLDDCIVKGSTYGNHRKAWCDANGVDINTLRSDQHIMHSCDNPPCINPDHLSLGSHLDNMADMRAKGRSFKGIGQTSHNARLTDADVHSIKDALRDPYRGIVTALAKKFGVRQQTISAIRSGDNWAHIKETLSC